MRPVRTLLAAFALAAASWTAADEGNVSAELAAIRERITALDLEGAVASASKLLERAGLTDDERADALALRAGAHVAAGELPAAEADYKSLLALRPGFVPDPSLTSKKSMERLARLQASMVATVHLDLDPADARLAVDGRPVVASGGTLKVLAGERLLHAERGGFDPLDTPVQAVAGGETVVRLRLVPNARGVLVRTDIPGVEVLLDRTRAGETTATADGATLLLPEVPIGEHTVELRKACFATETIPAMINVDLSDRSPKALAIVAMRPAAARITPKGARYAADLRVDGATAVKLPTEAFTVCPGPRAIEVVASGRVVWSGTIEAEESDRELDLTPRPNVVLVGDEWPPEWRDFAGSVSLRGRVPGEGLRDLSTVAGWKNVPLPPDTDLAVVVSGSKLPGERASVRLYGPALGAIAEPEAAPRLSPPRWSGSRIDASVVDSDLGPLVATVGAAAAGLTPGDRIVAVDGKDVRSVADLAARLDASAPGAQVALRAQAPGGEARTVSLTVLVDPRPALPADPVEAIVRGAWAAAEGAAGTPDAASALASLAMLLEAERRWAPAADAWRRAKTLDPGTFGARADYAIAADLSARGKKAEAVDVLRRVRESASARGDLVLAAAAADRLADLGVSAP